MPSPHNEHSSNSGYMIKLIKVLTQHTRTSMYSTRPHRPKSYKTGATTLNNETNMAITSPPSPSSDKAASSYYVRCVLAPHRAKRAANAYRAGMVVATSLCLMGAVIWLVSLAAATNVLDMDRQRLDWLAYGYRPSTITHDLFVMR